MSLRALEQVSSIGSLRRAWSEVDRRARGASRRTAGVDGQSVDTFARHVDDNLRSIQRELRSAGGFAFQPLQAHFIPKTDGSDRVICVPTVRDRIVQRALSNFLSDQDRCRLENNVSYGFVRNRGVRKAIRRACDLRRGQPWAYKTDVTAFFDTIPRSSVQEAIRRAVRAESLHPVLLSAVEVEISEPLEERQIRLRKHGIKPGQGVRQGMPLAPFFANLVLREFDRAIESNLIAMVRYADDIIAFGKSREECLGIDALVRPILGAHGLGIPDLDAKHKTRIYGPSEVADFLGVGLKKTGSRKYDPCVLEGQLEAIRDRILSLSTIEEAQKRGLRLPDVLQRLDAIAAAYEQTYRYCINAGTVIELCADARNEALTRIIGELGIEITKLDTAQRQFIGLN